MAERAGEPGLAQEPLRERRLGRAEDTELLERDGPVEVELAGDVDRGHAASADLPADRVTPDPPRDRAVWLACGAHQTRLGSPSSAPGTET